MLARRLVGWHRDEGQGSKVALCRALAAEALRIAPASSAREAVTATMVQQIADWTWQNYRPAAAPRPRSAAPGRRQATLGALISAARALIAAGRRPTQAAVAAEASRSEGTVRAHWPEVLAALGSPGEEPTVQVP